MPVILTTLPAGFNGDISRPGDCAVEAGFLDPTLPPLAYGQPIKMVNGKIQAIQTNDAASVVYGFLARGLYGSPTLASQNTYTGAVPNPQYGQAILILGYMVVKINGGTINRGGQVYMTNANSTTPYALTAVAGGNVAIPGVTWATNGSFQDQDANTLAEIRINKY